MKDLLLSLLSRNDIWMLVGSVDTADIVNVDETTAILVKDIESLGDNSLTVLVHWATDCSNELIVLDKTTAIVVHI